MKFKLMPLKPIVTLAVSLLLLSACQKKPETPAEPEASAPAISAPTETAIDENSQNSEATPAQEQADNKAIEPSNNNPSTDNVNNPSADTAAQNDNTAATPPSLDGAQVTEVRYQNESGAALNVVFETSREGILNAIISLPNQPKITLTAPEGQGNNPTYHSKDGKIELVSHEGGSSIDLIEDGKITSFTAVSADAAVITQS